ncbi:CD3337/EF1877 family mobilome membrane protein [Listeria monocytogenes]
MCLFIVLISCVCFMHSTTAHAEISNNMGSTDVIDPTSKDESSQTKPNVVKKGGVEVQIERFPLSRYQVNNEAADSKIKGIGVALSNIMFSVNHIVVLGVDRALDLLNSLDPINKFADKMSNISGNTFDTLKRTFVPLLWVFAITYMGYILIAKNNLRDSGKRFMLFIAVMLIGTWYAHNAGDLVKATNNVASDAQAKLLVISSDLLQMDKGKTDSVYGQGSKIKAGEEAEGTTTLLRNIYFDLALKKPYLIANYGTTNETAINKKTDSKKKDYSRIDKLLSYKLSDEADKKRQDYVTKSEVEKYDNENMATGNVWSQVGFSMIAPLASIVLAIPFLGVAVMNFLIQFVIVLLIFIIVFMFLISLIPQYGMTGFKGIGYLFGAFAMKILMFLLITLLYVISYMIDALIPPNNAGSYLVNLAVLSIILIFIVLKRNKIVSMLTAGKVKQFDKNIVQKTKDNLIKPAVQTAKPVAQGTNWVGRKTVEAGKALDKKFGAPTREKVRENVQRRKQQKHEKQKVQESPNVVPIGTGRSTQKQKGTVPQKNLYKQSNVPSSTKQTPSANNKKSITKSPVKPISPVPTTTKRTEKRTPQTNTTEKQTRSNEKPTNNEVRTIQELKLEQEREKKKKDDEFE